MPFALRFGHHDLAGIRLTALVFIIGTREAVEGLSLVWRRECSLPGNMRQWRDLAL